MPGRAADSSSRRSALVVLAVLAVLSVLGASYLRGKAAEAAWGAGQAAQRLAEDRILAERHRKASSRKLVISANLAEAQSSEFIPEALGRSGIKRERIDYGEATEGAGRFDKVTTTVITKAAAFSPVVDFLRDVEKNRPQLTLLDAALTREANADLWRCEVTYGALIPARSRN